MPNRVSPIERARAEIDELFGSDRPLTEVLEEVARLSVRLVMQTAVEAEVTAFLGRDRYQRRDEASPAGSRNGWQPPAAVRTTMGPVELERPKLRGSDERFASALFGRGVTRTNALEALVISGWVRGLSDRDIEASLAEALGPEAALSRSTVSRICQTIRDEFEAWKHRPLDGVRLDYLFLDASHFKMHPGAPAEPVLAAWGINTDGEPVFVALAPAASESTDAWDGFLEDLRNRGLAPPLLVISDGAPACSPPSNCTTAPASASAAYPPPPQHRGQGVQAGPGSSESRLLVDLRRHRGGARRGGRRRRHPPGPGLRRQVEGPLPLGGRVPHRRPGQPHRPLRFPAQHWRRIRHSNFIERTFGETRRRTKVIGRLPGEASCLGLVWAVLDRASRGWRGVTHTPAGLRLLQDLRRQLLEPPTTITEPDLAAA